MRGFFLILALIMFAGCGTAQTVEDSTDDNQETTLNLLVDAHYTLSHGWGHVFRCKVRDVLSGELEDTVIYLSVYGTVKLYGDLLLPLKNYQDLMLAFELNPEEQYVPSPGFRDSENRYWELRIVTPLAVLSPPTSLYEAFPGWRDFEGKASIFQLDSFPEIQYHHYRRPNPKRWVAGLKPGGTCEDTTGCVRVWQEDDEIRFIWITNPHPHGGKFYAFKSDTIDKVMAL